MKATKKYKFGQYIHIYLNMSWIVLDTYMNIFQYKEMIHFTNIVLKYHILNFDCGIRYPSWKRRRKKSHMFLAFLRNMRLHFLKSQTWSIFLLHILNVCWYERELTNILGIQIHKLHFPLWISTWPLALGLGNS